LKRSDDAHHRILVEVRDHVGITRDAARPMRNGSQASD